VAAPRNIKAQSGSWNSRAGLANRVKTRLRPYEGTKCSAVGIPLAPAGGCPSLATGNCARHRGPAVATLVVHVVKVDWRGRLLARARMVRRVFAHSRRVCSTELVVLSTIGVEKGADNPRALRPADRAP